MNNWNFTGNLGRDCEVAVSKAGKTFCNFPVAVSSGYGDNKKTTWVKCIIVGQRAEGQLPQYLLKGQKVAISGENCLETWTKQDGTQGATLTVFVNTLDLIGEKAQPHAPQQQVPQQYQNSQPAQHPHQPAQQAAQQQHQPPPQPHQQQTQTYSSDPNQPTGAPDDFNDDIPF